MAITFYTNIFPAGEVGVSVTTDSLDMLRKSIELTAEENHKLSLMSERRQKEWLSARFLVHKLSGRKVRAICLKDEFGKPYLKDSDFQISISHSLDRTAVIAAPYNVGIDVQEIVPKMHRISKKFVSDDEWSHVPEDSLEYLHIIWGAKEAMYKAWGKKKIDFKEHLYVPEFTWDGEKTTFNSFLKKANITMVFNVIAHKIDGFILVYVIEKSRYVS